MPDAPLVNSAPCVIGIGFSAPPTVVLNPTNAGSPADYTVTFRAQSMLAETDRVHVTFPAGTDVAALGGTMFAELTSTGGGGPIAVTVPIAVNGLVVSVPIPAGLTISRGDTVTLGFINMAIVNPLPVGDDRTFSLTVGTSTAAAAPLDAPVTSVTYQVTEAGLSNIVVLPNPEIEGFAATYRIEFNTQGPLSPSDVLQIVFDVAGGGNTDISALNGFLTATIEIIDPDAPFPFFVTVPLVVTGKTVDFSIPPGFSVGAFSALALTLPGVVNPVAGTGYQISLAAATAGGAPIAPAVNSADYRIETGAPIVSPPVEGESANVTIFYIPVATIGFSAFIDITFDVAGGGFTDISALHGSTNGTVNSFQLGPLAVAGQTVSLPAGFMISSGVPVRIHLTGLQIINPVAGAMYRVSVATRDGFGMPVDPPANSAVYEITVPPPPVFPPIAAVTASAAPPSQGDAANSGPHRRRIPASI